MTGDEVRQALAEVELATLGHTLEAGFCAPRIRAVAESTDMVGAALTVDLVDPDAYAVNEALLAARPGDVLVIRVAGGLHAPVGAVTVAAAIARGIVGIVVDGPVTDRSALRESGIPVFADGTTNRTTKRLPQSAARVNTPVEIGGVLVNPGDIVAADENGLLVLHPDGLDNDLFDAARASDLAEPALIEAIRSGEELSTLLATRPTPENPA